MRFESDKKLDFNDVLIRPKRSTLISRAEVSMERTYVYRNSKNTWTGVPIMASNMESIGTLESAKVMAHNDMFTCVSKTVSLADWEAFDHNSSSVLRKVAVSTGTSAVDISNVEKVINTMGIQNICLDVAYGYTEIFIDTIRNLRERFPRHTIIAGNVVTQEMTEELLLSGADIVKVGIASGSTCITHKMTGAGYPQLSAIIECGDAAHGLGGHIISDGGCHTAGDVAKAFGAGADFVMLGGMLSGHDENAGKVYTHDNKKYKLLYGTNASLNPGAHDINTKDYRAEESVIVAVPYRGPLQNTLNQILGGLRSTCTYVGAHSLKELSKRTTFIHVTQQLNTIYDSKAEEIARHLIVGDVET